MSEWEMVARVHQTNWPLTNRTRESLKRKFTLLYLKKAKTGDPHIPSEVLRAKAINMDINEKCEITDGEEGEDEAEDPGEDDDDETADEAAAEIQGYNNIRHNESDVPNAASTNDDSSSYMAANTSAGTRRSRSSSVTGGSMHTPVVRRGTKKRTGEENDSSEMSKMMRMMMMQQQTALEERRLMVDQQHRHQLELMRIQSEERAKEYKLQSEERAKEYKLEAARMNQFMQMFLLKSQQQRAFQPIIPIPTYPQSPAATLATHQQVHPSTPPAAAVALFAAGLSRKPPPAHLNPEPEQPMNTDDETPVPGDN
jgi:hypothetical protein